MNAGIASSEAEVLMDIVSRQSLSSSATRVKEGSLGIFERNGLVRFNRNCFS